MTPSRRMDERQHGSGGYVLPRYPFVEPPELSGRGSQGHYPVVIVGAGLCGLTMACDLASRGIEAVVLDDDDTVGVRGASSRGIVYARKSLEVFRRLGIWERIRDKGVQWFVGRTLVDSEVIYEFDMTAVTASEQPAFVNLQQFYVESFLVDRITELGRTQLRWRNRVLRAVQNDAGVVLEVDTPAGRYELAADWVIDASGLASAVRDGFGLETHAAKSTEDRWCITDVRFQKALPQERWTWVEAAANEGRAIWQHPMADGVWRLDFQMEPDSDPDYVSRADVAAARLRRHLGEDTEFELVWVGPYQYRAHLLDDFRAGRVFFIGDAAHVVSPFGARGGNTGIQDAENLSWKLALVLTGRAPERLLDTYSEERRAAAAVNLEVSRRSARFLAPRTEAEYALRSAVLTLARRYPFARALVNTGRLSIPHVYADSSLVTSGGQAIQNVPIVLPDGRRGTLIDLLATAETGLLGFWRASQPPDQSLLPELHRLEAAQPVRFFAIDRGGELASVGDPQGLLKQELGIGVGEIAVLRPDLHLTGIVEDGEHDELRRIVRHAIGHAAPFAAAPETSR